MAVPKEERTVEIIVNGTKANASLKEMSAAAAVLSNQVAKIAADDPKRAELIEQLQQMRQRLADTRAEVSGLLTAEQQLAEAQQQQAAATAAAIAEQQRAIEVGKASAASFTEMKTAASLLEKQLHELGANDPGRAALLTDLQTLRGRLEEARTAMGGVIKTEAQQRAEAEALRAQELALAEAEARRQREQVELVVNGQRVTASMREMRGAAAELERQLDELAQDDPARGPLIAALQELRARIRSVGEEVTGVTETTSRMRQVMTYAFGSVIGGGIEGLIDKVLETGKAVFDTTAKFETYGKVLSNALGSDSLGQKALQDIQHLAATTPFSIDELTSSFIKFVNRGLQPSMADLTKLGDLAASQGKSFDQLTEAVLDAGTGEFERLKEFGIAASKSGDQVSLSFKGINQTVANTPEAINAAILAFGEAKGVAGGMALIAGSLEGQLSNLGDTADQTAVEWGQTLRPAFVAVLSTMGFLLGVLKELPGFLKENKGALLGLAGALVVLNAEQVEFNLMLLEEAVRTKAGLVWKAASAAATDVMTFSWKGLNAVMKANPIGFVIGLVMLLVGALVTAYEKSEKFRAVINGLGAALKEFVVTYVKGAIEGLMGFYDVFMGVITGNSDRIKKGFSEQFNGLKAMYWDAGKNAAQAYGEGYRTEQAAQDSQANKEYEERRATFAKRIQDELAKRAKREADEEKKNRLEKLKNEEADLKERLAKVKADSEAEMRIKQQLVTNDAAQQLENEKKTAAERRIILADAEDKRVKLAQEFFEKRNKAAVAAALKRRLAEIEAEQHHQEMLLNIREAAVIAKDSKREAELQGVYFDAQRKIVALEAGAKKEIAQLTGTEQEKKKRTLAIQQELAAEVALVKADALQKQGELTDKYNEQDYKAQEEFIDKQLDAIEDEAKRKQAAFETMLDAGLLSQQAADDALYEARKAALERELVLVEGSLGKESKAYKKVLDEILKNETDHSTKEVASRKKATKTKQELLQAEMQTAGDVLDFTLQLLDQDEEARKKNHALYVALAAAKVLIDGVTEVQHIWETSSEFGPAGYALAVVQTALAAGRTAVALGKLRGGDGSDGGGSYWAGGATGDGAGLAVSPMGQLLQLTGMSVGAGGKLLDGSGFAVAGVVHEDEYVIPKWQLADPQVAAVAQWLEARRIRGFADGGPTSSTGPALPVPVASPSTDGEKNYAVQVQVQMLAVLGSLNERLAGVEQWQRELQVTNNLRSTQAGLQVLQQAKLNSAIRSKG